MRRRLQAQASIDELLHTVCAVGSDQRRQPETALANAPAATMSGRLLVAPVDKICQTGKGKKAAAYWTELRDDMMSPT